MNRDLLKDYSDDELLQSARDMRTAYRCRKDCTPKQKEINDRAAAMIADRFQEEISTREEERENEQ